MPNRSNSGMVAGGLCLVATVAFLFATITMGVIPRAAASQHRIELRSSSSSSAEDFWSRMVAPETARAIAADAQLQHTYLGAVELTAQLTSRLADRFAAVPEFQEASASLNVYRRDLAASTKPIGRRANPLESFGELLGLGGTGTGNMTEAMGGILATITAPITRAISSLGDTLAASAGGAALFLGTGIGAGAAQGLGLSTAQKSMQVAAKIAADNGMNATGLNPAIQNAAMGVTASLLGSVNVSSLGGAVDPSTIDFKGIAMSFATGLGDGASSGLNLSQRATLLTGPKGNTTADIAGTFAFGLTKSVTSNVDLSALGGTAISGADISQLTGGTPLSQFAVSFAAGLGSGAASGLKLTQAALGPPAGNTASDALGAFGFGLTDSVTSNIDPAALLSKAMSATSANSSGGIMAALGSINLAQTASSFATGLGTGAAAGLKLSNNIVGAPDPNGQDVPSIAGNFAFGLVKSVTENVDVNMVQAQLSAASAAGGGLSSVAGSVNVGRAAQGVAMGFLQGAGDAVNSMGGLQALINGTAVMSTTPLPELTMTFNDSVGGAATGFGQGLGGQGTLVAIQLLSQVNVTSLVDGFLGGKTMDTPAAAAAAVAAAPAVPAAVPATAPAVPAAVPASNPATAVPAAAPEAVPSTGGAAAPAAAPAAKRDYSLSTELVRRQSETGAISQNNSFNLTKLINADTISSVGQAALDALSCEGIGGLMLIGLGLVESGTISLSSGGNLNLTLVKDILPKGVLRFNSGGNTYSIDGTLIANKIDNDLLGAAGGVVVNGSPVISFVAYLTIHILSALLGFVVLVPLAVSMDAGRFILVRLKLSHVYPKMPRYINLIWLLLMGPLAIATIIFGVLAGGTTVHLRTVHGIVGLITVLVTLGGVLMQFVARMSSPDELKNAAVFTTKPFKIMGALTLRTVLHQTLLMLILPVLITGFADLSAVALCITRLVSLEAAIGFAAGLTFLYTVASASSSVSLMLATRDVRAKKSSSGDDDDYSNQSLKDKIALVRQQTEKNAGNDRAFERD